MDTELQEVLDGWSLDAIHADTVLLARRILGKEIVKRFDDIEIEIFLSRFVRLSYLGRLIFAETTAGPFFTDNRYIVEYVRDKLRAYSVLDTLAEL